MGPLLSLSPLAVLSLMDRWHPIVYWAKVQCLIGHSSGNWASVYAWPSLNLPPKKRRRGRRQEEKEREEGCMRTASQYRYRKKKLKKRHAMKFLAFCFDLSAPGVYISVCASLCVAMVEPSPPPPFPFSPPSNRVNCDSPHHIYSPKHEHINTKYTHASGVEVNSWWWDPISSEPISNEG